MTLRVRRQRPSVRTRLGRLVEGEERQQFLVNALFVTAIAAVVLILVGAVGLAWYNENLRPLARVGSVEIGPQLLRDRLNLEQWRIERESNRITQAQINGEIDAQSAQQRLAALQQRLEGLGSTGLDDLVDVIYQSQLAADEGITVSNADIDQRLTDELAGVEQRHALMIVVEPQAADEDAGPTSAERRIALERAEAAHAALTTGAEFADVAREFSDHETAANGGDLGVVTRNSVGDDEFADALFELELGDTTSVIRDAGGAYRIGRVTEIMDAPEEPGLRDKLLADVVEPNVRDQLRYEIASDRLREKITAEALAATPEQVRIAVIFIEGLSSGDPEEADGEIDYSEIVFAPNDDLVDAPDLPADDPAWTEAQADADAAFAELTAITDPEQRQVRFEALATAISDSPSADQAGAVGFVSRGIPPTAVGDALFDATHAEGDLIEPVRADAGWYVLMFHERRGSPEERIQAVRDALAEPGADFAEVARELSDGPEAEDGGEVGWVTRDQLTEELAEDIYALEVGQVSEPLELGDGQYFVKLEDKAVRPLDADQIPNIRISAFENWYAEKKDEAETNGTIVYADEELVEGDLDPGVDFGEP